MDASKESEEALRWAARYAQLLGATLDVVHAWHRTDELAWLESLPPPVEPTHTAQDELAKIVDQIIGPKGATKVTTAVIEGHAAKVLSDRAKGAALLVVGCRGFGGFDGLLLGSVSSGCVAHAPCSVVVVRNETGETP